MVRAGMTPHGGYEPARHVNSPSQIFSQDFETLVQ